MEENAAVALYTKVFKNQETPQENFTALEVDFILKGEEQKDNGVKQNSSTQF